jgi:16S rRNA processing protein RimM
LTLVSAGRVGRAHGRDGSFYVEAAEHPLPAMTAVVVGGEERRVVRRAGTDDRPLIRLSGLDAREDVVAVSGEPLLVHDALESDEWLAQALVGREVRDLGRVARVLEGPSCSLLELEDGTLVPFIADAIVAVDDVIEVNREFLGL